MRNPSVAFSKSRETIGPVAEEQAPEPTPAASLAEQYDLGDAPSQEEASGAAAPEGVAPAATASPPPAPSRERNPDGTFKKAHSARTLSMAQELGLSQSEIDEATPEVLDQTVYYLTKRALQESRTRAAEVATQASLSQKPAAAPPQAPPAEAGLGINETDYDPGLVRILKEHAAAIAEIKTLKERLDQVQGFQQDHIRESVAARCDQALFALKDERLGTARGVDLRPESDEYARRHAILMEAEKMAGGEKAPLQKKIAAIPDAYRRLFGTTVPGTTPLSPQPAPSSVRDAWNEGAVARPTNRTPQEPKGVKKAEKAVEAYQREVSAANGVQEAGEDGDDFLPGGSSF